MKDQIYCKLPVTTVSKWCDYKTWGIAQIFIAIFQTGGDHAQHHIAVFPEVTQLRNPCKVIQGGDAVLCQFCYNISS